MEKYESEWKHNLSDDQSLQLAKIMHIIDIKFQDELEGIFSEADRHQRGEQLRKEWSQDRSDHLNFWSDQAGNGWLKILKCIYVATYLLGLRYITVNGQTSNKWSCITYRIGKLLL